MSARLPARIVPPPAGRIFVKFDIENFHENLLKKTWFGQKQTKISVILRGPKYVLFLTGDINLLNPTCHVMHHQFNIQQL